MANYNSQYTGAQIDSAVGKALNPQTTPTAGSSELITSGGVKSALNSMPSDVFVPVLLDNNTDLNGVASGVAYGNPLTNAPSTGAYFVVTSLWTTHGFQFAIKRDDSTVYIRTKVSGTWGAWSQL